MKKYILIIVVFFTAGISACKKDFLSLEVNPNQPSSTTPQLTLAAAEAATAATVNTSYSANGVWMGYWTPSGNFVPSTTIQQFNITNGTFTGVWTILYQNLTNLNNLQVIAAKDPSLANYQAIAMILKAYNFQQLVDQFGNVPYTEAFQPSTILFPKYDKGIDIYHDLGKQLDAAIALINSKGGAAASPGNSDIIFGGNMTGWKKFANSLKLRLAIRMSTKFSNDELISDLASTASEGYLDETIQAAANPGYANALANGASQQSPFWLVYGNDTNGNPTGGNVFWRANQFFINLLRSNNDPRLQQDYYETLAVGSKTGDDPSVIQGNVFGDTKTTLANPNTSSIGPGLLQSPSQDAVIFSGAESLFLQAEAVVDGKIPGDAQALYQRGITASFVALRAGSTIAYSSASGTFAVTPASPAQSAALAVTYYSQDNVANVTWPGTVQAQKEAIIYQKWFALIGYNNLEPYLEYQRTGFPILPKPLSIDPGRVSDVAPIRQFYPITEVTTNPVAVQKEGTIDIFNTTIFWATKPN